MAVVLVALLVEAVGFSLLVTESLAASVTVVVVTVASMWGHVVLHECGHVVAALALRVPVVAVRIVPFTGWRRNEVEVVRSPSMPAVRTRMVLLAAAGPVTNLCTAAALVVAGNAAGPPTTRLALYGAAVSGALLGVVNLIPKLGPRTDGTQILYWLVRPAEMRAALRAVAFQAEVGRIVRSHVVPLDGDDEARQALTAFTRRCDSGLPQAEADFLPAAERLMELAGGADREAAAAIGRTLTLQFGLWYLRSAVVDRQPVERKEVVQLAELAQAAFDIDPSARVPLALAHLLNGREGEAQALLLGAAGPAAALLRDGACDGYPELASVLERWHRTDPPAPLFIPDERRV